MEALLSLIPPVTPQNIYTYAFVGGFIPPIIWLTLWLREDRKNPEPRRVIIGSFLFGALAAILAIPFQGVFAAVFSSASLVVSIFVFAFVEELVKYFSVYFSALKDKANDEALDPIIYMITAALGFAAMENTLYLINYLNNFDLLVSVLEHGKRFIGATLLHVLSSVCIGITLSLSHNKYVHWRPLLLPIGIATAVILHALFNIFVTNENTWTVVMGFVMIWVIFLVMLVALELLKKYFEKRRLKKP